MPAAPAHDTFVYICSYVHYRERTGDEVESLHTRLGFDLREHFGDGILFVQLLRDVGTDFLQLRVVGHSDVGRVGRVDLSGLDVVHSP